MKRILLATLAFIAIVISVKAETVPYIKTNSGKKIDAAHILNAAATGNEFVVAVPPNELAGVGADYIEIYITSPFNTTVRWRKNISGGSGLGTPITVPAYKITKISLTIDDEIREFEKVINKTFTLTSGKRFSVYVMDRKPTTSDGYLAIPTSSWGKEYIHLSNYDNPEPYGDKGAGFVVLAKSDYTHVTIKLVDQMFRNATPNPCGVGRTTGGKKGGDIIKVTLMKNQAYTVQGNGSVDNFDLSGSEITADSVIGVISYHCRTDLPVSADNNRNYLVEMVPPIQSWGKQIVTVAFDRSKNGGKDLGDLIRVVASQNNTTITMKWYDKKLASKPLIRSLSRTIQRGEIFEYNQNTQDGKQKGCQGTIIIDANKPILAHQYSYTGNWDNAYDFDPFMITLTPVEQYVPETVFQTPSDFVLNYYNFIAIGYLPSDTVGNTPFATNSVIDTNPVTNRPWTPNDINKAKLKSLKFGSSGELTPVPDGIFRNRIPTTGGWAPENSDGRDTIGGLYWFIYQTAEGVFQMVSEGPDYMDGQPLTKFGGYIYGFGGMDGYGWPAAVTFIGVKTQDTIAPKRQAKKTVCGTTQYTFTDSLDFWLAPPKDTVHQVDTWIKSIKFLTDTNLNDKKLNSYNMIFVDTLGNTIYTKTALKGANGKDSLDANKNIVYDSTLAVRLTILDSLYKFGVKVNDPSKEARAIIAVVDGASNVTYDTLYYYPPLISLDPNPMDFGKVRIKTAAERAASPTAVKSATITNVAHNQRLIKKIRLGSEIYGRTPSNASPYKISTATKLPLVGFNLDTMGGAKPNFYKVDIEFNPTKVSKDVNDKFLDTIYIQFLDTCSDLFIPISALSIAPRIKTDSIADFGKVEFADMPKCGQFKTIKNTGTDTLTISGYKVFADKANYNYTTYLTKAEVPLSPFTFTKSDGTPILPPVVKIAPNDSIIINYCFETTATSDFVKYVMFVNDAFREDDVKNLLNTEVTYLHAKTGSTGVSVQSLNFGERRKNSKNKGTIKITNTGATVVKVVSIQYKDPTGKKRNAVVTPLDPTSGAGALVPELGGVFKITSNLKKVVANVDFSGNTAQNYKDVAPIVKGTDLLIDFEFIPNNEILTVDSLYFTFCQYDINNPMVVNIIDTVKSCEIKGSGYLPKMKLSAAQTFATPLNVTRAESEAKIVVIENTSSSRALTVEPSVPVYDNATYKNIDFSPTAPANKTMPISDIDTFNVVFTAGDNGNNTLPNYTRSMSIDINADTKDGSSLPYWTVTSNNSGAGAWDASPLKTDTMEVHSTSLTGTVYSFTNLASVSPSVTFNTSNTMLCDQAYGNFTVTNNSEWFGDKTGMNWEDSIAITVNDLIQTGTDASVFKITNFDNSTPVVIPAKPQINTKTFDVTYDASLATAKAFSSPITVDHTASNTLTDVECKNSSRDMDTKLALDFKDYENGIQNLISTDKSGADLKPGKVLYIPVVIDPSASNLSDGSKLTKAKLNIEYDLRGIRYYNNTQEMPLILGDAAPGWTWTASEAKKAGSDTIAVLTLSGSGSEISKNGVLVIPPFELLFRGGQKSIQMNIDDASIDYDTRNACISHKASGGNIEMSTCAINLRGLFFGEKYTLQTPNPSPINTPTFTLKYTISYEQPALIEIYNSMGERVKTVVNGVSAKGDHEDVINTNEIGDGVFYIKMSVGAFSDTKKIVVIR